MTIEEIRKNKPKGATGYYEKDEGRVRYIRKTPKHYFYQTHTNGKWWKVPVTAFRYISENYKPL